MTFQEDWDDRSAYIELALQKSGGAYSIDDVHEYVVNGDAHFEPVEEGGAIFFFHEYPNKKVLRIWLAGGILKSDLTPVLECAVREADRLECDAIEVEGRKGWERVLQPHGFKHKRTVLVKELEK